MTRHANFIAVTKIVNSTSTSMAEQKVPAIVNTNEIIYAAGYRGDSTDAKTIIWFNERVDPIRVIESVNDIQLLIHNAEPRVNIEDVVRKAVVLPLPGGDDE